MCGLLRFFTELSPKLLGVLTNEYLLSVMIEMNGPFLLLLFIYEPYVCVTGFVQFLQYYYQSGCLYRLRALGERNQLDLTVGESHSSRVIDAAFHVIAR